MTDHHHQEISSKPSYQSSTIGSLSINATTISSAASTTTSKSNSLIDPSSKTTPLGSSSSTPTSSSSSTSSSSAVAEGEATTTVTAINSDNAASELYLSSSPSRLKTPDDDQDTTIQQSENHPDHPLNQPIIRPIQPQSHQTQQSTPRSSSSPLVDPILSNKLFSSQPSNPSTSALSSVYSPLNPLSALLTPITPLPKQSAIPFFNKTVQQNSQLSSPRQQPSQTLPVIPDELLLALSREQNPHHHIQPAPSSPLSQPTISGLSSSSPAPDPRSSHLPYPQAQPPNNHKSSSNPLIQRKSSPLISNPRSNSHTPVRSKISKIVATVTTSTAASLSSSSPASQPQPHPSSAWDHSPARDSSQHHLRNLSADLSSPASRPSLDHHPNPAGDSSSSGLGSLLRSSLHRSLGFLPDIPTTPITLDLDHDRHPSQSSEPQCTAIDPPESSRLNDLHRQPNLDLFNPSLAESADPGPSRSASNHLIPSTLSNHPCSAFETPTQSIEHTLLSNAPSSHQLSSISATSSVTPRHNLRSEQPNIGKSFGAGVKSLFHLRSSHSQPNHSKPDTSTSTQPFNPQSSSKSTSSVNRRYKNLNAGNSGADITESQPALSSTLLSSPETSQNSTSVTPTLILLPLNATAPLVSSPLLYSSLNLPVNQKVQDSSDTAQSEVLPPSPISPLREPNAAPSSPSMSSSGLFGAARSSKKSQGGQSGQIPVHSDSSKVKDTIWNRMGFSSGSSVSQPHSTSSSAKRGFLRQPHTQNSGSSSNSKPPLTSQGEKHVKHSSPSTRVSHGARSRASFSFDHKAHTQLVNTDESQSKPFGFFSYSHSSENYRTDYKDLSSKPSKRRSKPTRSELHSGDWAGHTIRHENDSEEAAKLRQPLYSELNKPETAAILEPKIHSHSQWRISNPSISLEDELAEDEVETGIPWRNRENFTHELKSGHSRDRYLTAEEAEVEEGGSDDEEDNISEKIPSDSLESVGDISTRSEPRSHLRSSGSADSPLQIGKCLEPSDTSRYCSRSTQAGNLNSAKLTFDASSSGLEYWPSQVNCREELPLSYKNASSHFRFMKEPRTKVNATGMREKIQARSAGSAAAPLDPLVMASKSVTEPLREQKTTEENSSSSQEAIFSGEKDFLEDAPRTAPLRLTPNTQHLQSFSSSSKFSTELESPRNRSLSDTLIRRTRSVIGLAVTRGRPPHHFYSRERHSRVPERFPRSPGPASARRLEELDSCKNSVQYSDSQTIQKIDVDRFKHGFLDAKSEIEESGLDSNDAHSEDECFLDTPSSREALHVKADFKIGIAGPKGVGKSTIINRALRRPLASSSTVLYEDRNQNRITSYVSSVTNSATGKTKTLQVLEIDQMILSEKFMKKNDKEGLSWPKRLPPLDGMLLCYDAMDPNALDHLRPLLHSFWTRGGISLIVLACKSDKNEEMNATSPLKAAELVNVYGTGMIQLDGGVEDVGKKMRNSFNWIMKAIKEARGEPRSYSSASTSFVGSCYGEDLAHSRPSSIVATNFNGQSETLSNRVVINSHSREPSNQAESKTRSEHPSTFHGEAANTCSINNLVSKSGSFSALHCAEENTTQQIELAFSRETTSEVTYAIETRRPPVGGALEQADDLGNWDSASDPLTSTQPVEGTKKNPTIPEDFAPSPEGDGLRPIPILNRHAARKAIVMSQRGSDMDLHLDKTEIIDKFVFATVSGNEPSFVDQFIIIFRRFATPLDVLGALISRFEFVSAHLENDPLLTRYAHMKICHVLMNWVETYPGDFVKPRTLMVLKAFNMLTLTATWLQHYGDEMLPMTKAIARMTDEDVGWALPDTTDEEMIERLLETLPRLRAAFSPTQAAQRTKNLEFIEDQLSPVMTSSSIGLGSQATALSLFNEKQDSFRSRADTFSSHDQTTTINSDYTPASANSSPVISVHAQNKLASGDGPGSGTTESFSLGLSLSHKGTRVSSLNTDQKAEYKLLQDFAQQLMGNTEDMIALQITRLEWDIFAEMKPRHLIRYVLAPRDPKNPRVALRDPNSPIARSTDFLNHLAVWASSMILIQEKLKNRARMLLKLMKVAYELRDMDDFHSLMGVLAGIEAQPVYRLEATFEVVQQMDSQAYRRYLSLKKLMSSQKSFSAYRLARQTASAQCVPYLGTYLQDITAINEVKEDMKDGKVNLTKFLQISKAAATVLQCEKLAPEIQIDENLENLITKAPVLNEDAQYELSYKYKPRAIPYHLQHQNNAHSSSSQLQQSQQSGVSGIGNNKAPIGTSQVVKGTRRLKQLIHTAINN